MNLEETEAGSEAKHPQSPRSTRPLNLRRLSLEIASTLGGTTLNFGTTAEEGGKVIKDGDNQRGSTADAYLIDTAIRKLSSKVQLPLGGVEEEDAEDEGKKVAEAWWLSRATVQHAVTTPLTTIFKPRNPRN